MYYQYYQICITYYILSVHNNVSSQWHNIYNQVTLRFDRVPYLLLESTGEVTVYCKKMVIGNELVELEVIIIYVCDYDGITFLSRFAVMWPDCIYFITVMIYCCVLTVYNTLYIFTIIKILLRRELRAEWAQEMLAVTRSRNFCFPGCYPKIYRTI